MAAAPGLISNAEPLPQEEPLAQRLARSAVATSYTALPAEVIEKTKLCLIDLIGCAFESYDLPWSRQARALAQAAAEGQGAAVIGAAQLAGYGDAAFANAVMGHGLVREDMHSGSISHLGIVVLPTLLALAQYRRVSGRDFISAAVVGYEVGGQVGRARHGCRGRAHSSSDRQSPVRSPQQRRARACSGWTQRATTSAIALGANTTLDLTSGRTPAAAKCFSKPASLRAMP